MQPKLTVQEMLSIEKERPGSFSKENISFNKDILEKIKTISHESINRKITQLNTEFIQAYEEKYRALLQLTGSTFETIAIETQRQADSMLSFGKIRYNKLRKLKRAKK